MDKEGLGNHILPTSANLLGICFLIFSLAQFQSQLAATLLDEFSAVAIVFFLVSCFFSYFSLRAKNSVRFERIADNSFLCGLLLMAVPVIMLAFTYFK
ncbi:hypothetical protein CIK05_08215 [Bdellovibrio sp. qaytius]|nr:hypothetical protein CIK05_08215 [Bdellovibrio sp. qaytius]